MNVMKKKGIFKLKVRVVEDGRKVDLGIKLMVKKREFVVSIS